MFAAVLFASVPTTVLASPEVPMCVAEQSPLETAPITLVKWHAPMCGPSSGALAVEPTKPSEARAFAAYRAAVEQIAAAS